MYLKFTSDFSVAWSGFKIQYISVLGKLDSLIFKDSFFSAKHNEQEINLAISIEGPMSSQEIGRLCISARSIDFASLYDFSIGFWNCSNSVVVFAFRIYIYRYNIFLKCIAR